VVKLSSFKKISKGEIRGWLREDLCRLLPEVFYDDPESYIRGGGGEVIKESRLRWAAILNLQDEINIFLKRDRTKGNFEFLKYFFFPSKARKEWFTAYQLQKMNLPVPKPYGWLERVHRRGVTESYYLSEAIGRGAPLIEEAALLKDEKNLKGLVKTVKRLHQSGLFHQDLHAGNFLWDGDSFLLVDLHRARILSSLSIDRRLWNLSHLFHSLRSIWAERDHSGFLETYFEGEPLPSQKKEEYLRKIHVRMDRLQKRQWRSRTRRCLKESTEFSVGKETGMTIYHRKEFSLDRLNRAIEDHHSILQKNPTLLVKQSPEVVVSLLKDGKDQVCVKQFRHSRLWDSLKECFRTSKGRKAWISGNGLRSRGIASLKTLALVEKRSGWIRKESFLVMEALEHGREMDRYILGGWGGIQEKRAFIKAFALWLSHLHNHHLYHQDMKTCNVLVSEDGKSWKYFLLDLEDVLLDEQVDEKRLFINFLQLNTSIPRTMSRTDRLRFYREYQRHRPVVKEDKGFLSRLIKKSRERGIVYVSPDGVVEERSC
jgi:tRNA A-37 threonylcarbamoyl transferase component Bud32